MNLDGLMLYISGAAVALGVVVVANNPDNRLAWGFMLAAAIVYAVLVVREIRS